MSIHYGLYSLVGEGEWVRSVRGLTDAQYAKYFDAFDPAPGACAQWARAAKSAGAKTLLLTAKHHEGFCLWDSSLTAFKSTNTPCKRDIVREFVTACRAEGLRVGLYYSLVDWHHPDCPAAGDRQHPLRHHPDSPARDKACVWSRYVQYLHAQVEELLTHYGVIDLLVFDFPYWDYRGEKWGATELIRKVRALQPNVVTNDRIDVESIKRAAKPAWAGDIDHSEMNIPRFPVADAAGQRIAFEAWFPLTNSWSTNTSDRNFKLPTQLVHALVNCVSKGGNMCLNPATESDGSLNSSTHSILAAMGAWLRVNGESVYGCGDAGLDKPEWGRFTRNGGKLYAHVLDQPVGHISLPALRGRVKNPTVLATGSPAIITDYWNPGIQTFDAPADIFFNLQSPVAATHPLPDPMDTVVRFDITSDAERTELLAKYADDFKRNTSHTPIPA